MNADDIIYAPIPDHVADLRNALQALRERPFEAGWRFAYKHEGRAYVFAYAWGDYFFGCPENAIGGGAHTAGCICRAATEAELVANMKVNRGLLDGAEDASIVRFRLGGEDC